MIRHKILIVPNFLGNVYIHRISKLKLIINFQDYHQYESNLILKIIPAKLQYGQYLSGFIVTLTIIILKIRSNIRKLALLHNILMLSK